MYLTLSIITLVANLIVLGCGIYTWRQRAITRRLDREAGPRRG
jgi:hypothetical protein